MNRRLVILVAILAALIVGSLVILRVMPPKGLTSARSRPAPAKEAPSKPMPAAARPDPAGYDPVTAKVSIPPLSEFPPDWKRAGCPHLRLRRILSAEVGPSNGVFVLAVAPGGAAAKAGIQPGDRLGGPDDCAETLYGAFAPREEARTVEWTVRRPKSAELREAAAKEAEQILRDNPALGLSQAKPSDAPAVTTPPRPAAERPSPESQSPTRSRSEDRPR